MKECDSRYFIGGKGHPSRGYTGQGEERAEVVACGFQLIEAIVKHSSIQKLSYGIFIHVQRF